MFTIGCDPELFVTKNGKAVSAHGLIPGTKEAPHKTPNGAVQVDGMALEFNTDPVPLADFEAFNRNIVNTIREMRGMVPTDHSFRITPTQDFDADYMEAQPDEAKHLGCDPDWNAYTLDLNPTPNGNVNFRTASGHIHIGWGSGISVDDPDHIKICAEFVKFLDTTVGVYMTVIDQDSRRRELYGKAGAFRPKPYGVEYRTPSNVWLTNKAHRQNVHRLVVLATDIARMAGGTFKGGEVSRNIINEGDVKSAVSSLASRCSHTLVAWKEITENALNNAG